TDAEFSGFDRGEHPLLSAYVTMTDYDETLTNVEVAYPHKDIEDTFAQVISRKGLRQLHIAETEKYAHVTFFFNGGVEEPVAGEDRCLIPSPKVKTYDLQPEMSAGEVCEEVIRRIKEDVYDVVILNFANPDMVGHTGVIEAACKAVTFVDGCLGRVVNTVLEASGRVLLTADHGNVECLRLDGEPMTAHTTNPVPFILIDDKRRDCSLREGGRLEDIAPTMLHLLGLPQPELMTGKSLIIE
ncbi:MAG: 2,3-bisphosphoglycerate-independent phosphoglycerate mutase, partial [Firmicutes bacterium]|nr:2,3-bisphosphoglycerate-independent phosphoglycerate mutase [Bacillota bacterium]